MTAAKKVNALAKFPNQIALGLLSALLMILAFPGSPFPMLVWVALVPSILVLPYAKPGRAALIWFMKALIFRVVISYWFAVYIYTVFEMPLYLTIGLFSILCIWEVLPYAVIGYLGARFNWISDRWGSLKFSIVFTLLFVVLPTVFPSYLSMSLFRSPILTQVADIGGEYFVLFFILWVNALFAQIILSFVEKKSYNIRHVVALGAIGVFIFGYGFLKLRHYDALEEESPLKDYVRIGYVQPNLPGWDLSWIYGEYVSAEEMQNNFITTVDLTRKMVEENYGLDVVIWPEITEDFPYYNYQWVRDAIETIVVEAKAPLLFESMYPWNGDSGKPYLYGKNAIIMVKAGYEVSQPYYKVNLIPFSEYLPGESKFPFLRKWFPKVGKIEPGDKLEPIKIDEKLAIIPLICYDGVFPSFVRRFAKKGGNVLVSFDNDTNFGPTRASEAHFAAEYYRVLENRMPLVRVSNPGVSSTVLISGRVLAESETNHYKKDYSVVNIFPGRGEKTLYQRGGYLLVALMGVVLLGVLGYRHLVYK